MAEETLVVISKVKKFIKEKADMNTSASAIEALTKIVEKEISQAIENARNAKRKTVLDRDFSTETASE
ncbi:MAG: hypothetical protein JXA94_02015 [Parachlamydiales bacterium]|nr:hypothetical protein [Parachlamydiales bacterium]